MYMITVTKNGHHYFATQKMNKKVTDIGLLYRHFQKKFSEMEGFSINIYRMTSFSNDVTKEIEEIITEDGWTVVSKL